jgi:hypothetical protein
MTLEGHPGELDAAEQARVDRILDLMAMPSRTEAEDIELEDLEAEQVAVEATRTGPGA